MHIPNPVLAPFQREIEKKNRNRKQIHIQIKRIKNIKNSTNAKQKNEKQGKI
jgi:hypothetical protein